MSHLNRLDTQRWALLLLAQHGSIRSAAPWLGTSHSSLSRAGNRHKPFGEGIALVLEAYREDPEDALELVQRICEGRPDSGSPVEVKLAAHFADDDPWENRPPELEDGEADRIVEAEVVGLPTARAAAAQAGAPKASRIPTAEDLIAWEWKILRDPSEPASIRNTCLQALHTHLIGAPRAAADAEARRALGSGDATGAGLTQQTIRKARELLIGPEPDDRPEEPPRAAEG